MVQVLDMNLGNETLTRIMTVIIRIINSLEEFKEEMGEFKEEMRQFGIETNMRSTNLEATNRNLVSRFDNQFWWRGEIVILPMPTILF